MDNENTRKSADTFHFSVICPYCEADIDGDINEIEVTEKDEYFDFSVICPYCDKHFDIVPF